MNATQLALQLDEPARPATINQPIQIKQPHIVPVATGEKAKARDLLAAIRTLKTIETENRPATEEEKHILARFPGFGPLALSIFPDPVRGGYKDSGWWKLGQ